MFHDGEGSALLNYLVLLIGQFYLRRFEDAIVQNTDS